MASSKEKPFWGAVLTWIGSAAIAALFLAALQRPPDGTERAELAQFIGRFHPLLVHGPIALILLVPILEIAGAFPRTRHLRAAAGFVLGLAAAVAIGAALDGWLLARSGGYGGNLVVSHMWGGISLAAVSLAAAGVRRVSAGRPPRVAAYRLLLASAIPLLVWTSHGGGELSHGDTFLTQYMPDGLRSFLGVAKPKPRPVLAVQSPASATLYSTRIAPLLDQRCVSCHGPKKTKGGLRMDSYAGLMKGGEDGPVIAPWQPLKSEICRRITLEPDDDDFMPSGGKKPLSPDEVKLIQDWIAAGASDRQPAE